MFPYFFVSSAPFMSDPICQVFFLLEHLLTPSNFDSVLNPHANYNSNNNIDQHLGCNCKHYDSKGTFIISTGGGR